MWENACNAREINFFSSVIVSQTHCLSIEQTKFLVHGKKNAGKPPVACQGRSIFCFSASETKVIWKNILHWTLTLIDFVKCEILGQSQCTQQNKNKVHYRITLDSILDLSVVVFIPLACTQLVKTSPHFITNWSSVC